MPCYAVLCCALLGYAGQNAIHCLRMGAPPSYNMCHVLIYSVGLAARPLWRAASNLWQNSGPFPIRSIPHRRAMCPALQEKCSLFAVSETLTHYNTYWNLILLVVI